MDKKVPRAEAIAISGNKILAVGTNKEIYRFASAKTEITDAKGKLVLPGFNDSHVHFMSIGNQFSSLDLRDAKSPQEIAERLAFYVKFVPKGRWILGSGWNHEKWTPSALPTKELIDRSAPENPVLFYHSDKRTALANSLALKLAGFDKIGNDFDKIPRDENGEPTGILRDSAVLRVRKAAPAFLTKQWLGVAETASNYAASLGVTSVQDMSADDFSEIYRALASQGKLKTRIYDCVNLFEWQKFAHAGIRRGDGDEMTRGGCLKGFSDGDADSLFNLYKYIHPADKAGFQVMIHAIGNNANEIVLSVFERVTAENGARDRRFRVEHAHNVRLRDLPRFGKSNIIASMQPHLFPGGAWSNSESYRALLDTNAVIAFGSDAAITDFNPFLGIYSAFNRKSPGDQTISVEEAVRAYTVGSAYAEFQENVKGTISAGKLADIIILSNDIFSISPEEIRQTKILTTIVDGKIVYEYK